MTVQPKEAGLPLTSQKRASNLLEKPSGYLDDAFQHNPIGDYLGGLEEKGGPTFDERVQL
ncbi:hypothetical protein CCR75_004182 [Bremia lactucae]|uniref:Uncharacterized protein n=1 Tax=Bremia lactucae TaxID=4779 RepID=A0A976FJW6_BRELC|nr:hypothetical protein CCR75_004182 [Bremia lactucae]